ncbi:MAG: butyryl-CoA dehydrogenase [Bermanella sp.]|jgi:butyryl-CoA dehydrogenase|uniref:SDR family NAD(P)-dependent oxidoreductase n=1 Tax=Glaciecola sp. 33A TaxID=2057807 RepID=UPI000C34B80D|nr:SDR family oxidoreductase [Glaciecola sp. 33A]PKI02002.1 short-chain dehydrogenase [Glaciecola sp. 33A]
MPVLHDFFASKTVVITGAASGIGRALANVFADLECKVAICDIDESALSDVALQLKSTHPALTLFTSVLDVANKTDWGTYLADVASHCEHIDIVINNAGIEGSSQPAWASDDELLKRVMNVNFYGMVYGSKAALPYLTQRSWAALVNVSSVFGLLAPPNTADYCASKFAIRGYTESLRAELELVHPQVQVHLVHPGGIDTNITRLEQSKKFKERFLTTKPETIALHIANSIMRNKARIVFGNQATKTHIASRILPLKWLSKLSGKEIHGLGMEDDYRTDHAGFTIKKSDH